MIMLTREVFPNYLSLRATPPHCRQLLLLSVRAMASACLQVLLLFFCTCCCLLFLDVMASACLQVCALLLFVVVVFVVFCYTMTL